MDIPSDLLARLAVQDGVVTTGQALELGLRGRDVGRMRAARRLVRIRWGAYAAASEWNRWDDRQRHLACARAVGMQLTTPHTFSHLTAAVAHDLPLLDLALDDVHVIRADNGGLTRRAAGVWHHAGPLPAHVRAAGLDVTQPARTAFDVARVSDLRAGVCVMDAVLARGVSEAVLRAQVDATERWPGSARARRALSLADGRSQSPGETVARLAFVGVGLAPADLQVEVRTDVGLAVADFGWQERGVLGEFDGRIKYGRLLAPGQDVEDVLVRERHRELAIERAGWVVERFTWAEVHDARLVRDRLLAAFARASAGRRP